MTDRDKRDAEKRIERLRQARQADRLKRDDADGPRELSETEESHIEAVIEDARAENPEALRDAEEQIRRERESGELDRAREERANSEPAPLNAAEKSTGSLSSGLTPGERSLLDALDPRGDEREREDHRGDDGDDHR